MRADWRWHRGWRAGCGEGVAALVVADQRLIGGQAERDAGLRSRHWPRRKLLSSAANWRGSMIVGFGFRGFTANGPWISSSRAIGYCGSALAVSHTQSVRAVVRRPAERSAWAARTRLSLQPRSPPVSDNTHCDGRTTAVRRIMT